MIHEDWQADRPGVWRERHPWGVSYPGTPEGLVQALADLDSFAATGEAPAGVPVPPFEDRYQIHYADLTLSLFNVGSQRLLDVRFPLVVDSATHTEIDSAWWTNHPACVSQTFVEEITNPPIEGAERWLHIVFDITGLLSLGDMDGDGFVDLIDFSRCAECLTGPETSLSTDACTVCDYDGDNDADLSDMAAFTRSFTGS